VNACPDRLVLFSTWSNMGPTIVFFLIFQRNIMAGLTEGGVKG